MTSPVVIKSAGVGGGRSEALGGIIKLAKVIGSFFFFFGLNSVLKFKSGNKSVLVDFCYFFFSRLIAQSLIHPQDLKFLLFF